MEKGWLGLPYYSISEHYYSLFGEKVYKIPVSVVETCPNREGLKGMQVCVFCDVWGSAAKSESLSLDLRAQIEKYHVHIQRKFKANKFLAYFQAYTNTFTKLNTLRSHFDIALSYPWMKGFVIGTRPDCISQSVLNLWAEYHERSFVGVELGVQSFFDHHLAFMKRGHTSAQSLKSIDKIAQSTKVDLGIHLIFGSPNETRQEIIDSAKICNDLPITNVKLHNLHVLKHTPLETLFNSGGFVPIEREEYAQRVELFIQHLSPKIKLHRLAAFAPRWDELVAPAWTADKMGTHQYIVDFLRSKKSYQSQNLFFSDPLNIESQSVLRQRSEPVQNC